MDQKKPGILPHVGYSLLYGGAIIQLRELLVGGDAGSEHILLLISWMMLCYLVIYIIKTHTLGNRKLQELSGPDIQRFYNYLLREGGKRRLR